jgi:hypothetical protein
MKKTFIVLLMVLLCAMLFISCNDDAGSSSPKETYIVTFRLGESSSTGSAYDAQEIVEGEKATKPDTNPVPSDKHKIFKYWSADNGATEFKFNETPITKDIVLQAVYRDYEVGDTGPAGGTIFYINENYDASSTEEAKNWKYLEAAPADITVTNEDDTTTSKVIFGYYLAMVAGGGYNAQVITTENSASDGSGANAAIGQGKSNTKKLVQAMPTVASSTNSSSPTPTTNYAAKLCTTYEGGGCTDWFLPSLNELKALYSAYAAGNVGGTWHTRYSSSYTASDNEYYWTSSEYDANSAWTVCFGNGSIGGLPRNYAYAYVRPVRSF